MESEFDHLDDPEFQCDIRPRAPLTQAEKLAIREEWLIRRGKKVPTPVRSAEDWRVLLPRYPEDPEDARYVLSFELEDFENITKAMDRYGFAVVRALSPERAAVSAADALADLSACAAEHRPETVPISLHDCRTWENKNWPRPKSKFLVDRPAMTCVAHENRTDERLHALFTHLIGTDQLWSSIDNWGVMRGTTNLRFDESSAPEERPRWRHHLLPHWDCNPHLELQEVRDGLHPRRYQGLVALVDCPVERGTFSITPGASPFLPQWCLENEGHTKKRCSIKPKQSDPLCHHLQPIPLRAGEMVIWGFDGLHANVANHCADMRVIQFIRMMPALQVQSDKDRYSPAKIWADYPDDMARAMTMGLDQRRRRLLGLEPYPDIPLQGKPRSHREGASCIHDSEP